MGKGSGFGKVILFGEHFVVHGVPGIVSAIDLTAAAEVKRIGEGITVKDEEKAQKVILKRREPNKERPLKEC